VNSLRTKLVFLVLVACQLALFLADFSPVSWWEGP
jgi:hypothetical protein